MRQGHLVGPNHLSWEFLPCCQHVTRNGEVSDKPCNDARIYNPSHSDQGVGNLGNDRLTSTVQSYHHVT